MRREKIGTVVSFPIVGLDLSDYVLSTRNAAAAAREIKSSSCSSSSSSSSSSSASAGDRKEGDSIAAESKKPVYDLFAVVVRCGVSIVAHSLFCRIIMVKWGMVTTPRVSSSIETV